MGGRRLPPLAEPGLVLFLFFLDRASKAAAVRWLEPRGAVPLLPFFHLTYVENTGAAFGLGRGSNRLFVALSLALTAGLLAWRRSLGAAEKWARLGIVLILAGALGNLFDRLAFGYVVDYLDFIVWPVFNLADSCITVGAGLVAFSSLRREA